MSSAKSKQVRLRGTLDDALALLKRTGDKFYADAFMIESWLGKLADNTVREYSEKSSASERKLQTGEAARLFAHIFKHSSNREFARLFRHLTRFAHLEGAYSWAVSRGYGAMYKEGEFPQLRELWDREDTVAVQFQRRFVSRLCGWLDAIIHWQAHERYHASPESFDVDSDKRELAVIGWQQKHFSKLASVDKEAWEWHHSLAAQRFGTSPKWATVGIAMSSQKSRSHAYPRLDEFVIHFWPLVKRHNWTYRDLLNVIRMTPSHRNSYPSRKEQELATYCINVLGLRKQGTGKTAQNGRPGGWKVARRLCSAAQKPS